MEAPFFDMKGDSYVCQGCVGNETLYQEIERDGEINDCSYCNRNDLHCVTLHSLARRVAPVYEQLVSEVEHEPEFDDDSDTVEWVQRGESPTQIISDMIESSEFSVAEDIVEYLSSVSSSDDLARGLYEASNDVFEVRVPENQNLRYA